jgi:hypothetical protein
MAVEIAELAHEIAKAAEMDQTQALRLELLHRMISSTSESPSIGVRP